jgi:DNA-binding LacI/PurR family transcriptional regulator
VIFEEKRDYRSMGYLGMNKLLGQPCVPSAVLCFNDSIAFGAYKAIAEKGLRVPGDVALVGYDDSPICDMMPVGLTTVKYPKYETGKCASELLWELTAGESRNANQTVILNPELIIRETCGAGMRGAAELEDEHTAV